jgi:hypothetical protein
MAPRDTLADIAGQLLRFRRDRPDHKNTELITDAVVQTAQRVLESRGRAVDGYEAGDGNVGWSRNWLGANQKSIKGSLQYFHAEAARQEERLRATQPPQHTPADLPGNPVGDLGKPLLTEETLAGCLIPTFAALAALYVILRLFF